MIALTSIIYLIKIISLVHPLDTLPELQKFLEPLPIPALTAKNAREEFYILNAIFNNKHYHSKLVDNEAYSHLNRYTDVLPYEHTIVRLDDQGLNRDNYFNANYVENPLFPGQNTAFILTQGPLKTTVNDFWTMVERKNVRTIVAIVEPGSLGSRCYKYWPEKSLETSDFEVTVESDINRPLYQHKRLRVRRADATEDQVVNHYHIHVWHDMSSLDKSNIDHLLVLFDEMYAQRLKTQQPIVIHCSAGIGRSGTLAAAYSLYEFWRICQANGLEFKVSIFDLVFKIREMRYGAIQRLEQYEFLYNFVKQLK